MADRKEQLRQWDRQHLWHPFTQMKDWCDPENTDDPLILQSGEGAYLFDIDGNRYLDGNSSIWTNIHGHNHPTITAAIKEQAEQLAHCSALGFSNEPAIELSRELVSLFPEDTLSRVFLSDDGSTAIECACKMAIQFRQLTGEPERIKFLSFTGAYHGDTAGAASLGGISTFHERFASTGFDVEQVAELADLERFDSGEFTAVILEPLIQGAAGMRVWPGGMLASLRQWCDESGVFLILDEVMTGFGRTGTMFACEREEVIPDFLCLAKGLTGGYLPLAATLTTERVFEAFLGEIEEQKTFYYGHSYCGNPLGCAAALASLHVFRDEQTLSGLPDKIDYFHATLKAAFGQDPLLKELRLCGLIAGIEFHRSEKAKTPTQGAEMCKAARQFGLLTRPIGDTIVLMPPLCITTDQIDEMVEAVREVSRLYSV